MEIPFNNTNPHILSSSDDQIIMSQDFEEIDYTTRKLIEEYKLTSQG